MGSTVLFHLFHTVQKTIKAVASSCLPVGLSRMLRGQGFADSSMHPVTSDVRPDWILAPNWWCFLYILCCYRTVMSRGEGKEPKHLFLAVSDLFKKHEESSPHTSIPPPPGQFSPVSGWLDDISVNETLCSGDKLHTITRSHNHLELFLYCDKFLRVEFLTR